MSKNNPQLAAEVARVLKEHGLGARGQRARTGLSHVTIGNMLQGIVPEVETILAFARGFHLDVNEWLELADYDPVATAADRLKSGLRQLNEEFGRPVAVDLRGGELQTFEQVDNFLAETRERIEKGLI